MMTGFDRIILLSLCLIHLLASTTAEVNGYYAGKQSHDKTEDTTLRDIFLAEPKKTEQIMCYTCMSDNVPQITKDIMKQTMRIPEHAESEACNDPFGDAEKPTADTKGQNPLLLTPCSSACIKVVSENKYLKIVLRGCLGELYDPAILGYYQQSAKKTSADKRPQLPTEYVDVCDRQRQHGDGIGEIVTDTCVCTSDYCNAGVTLNAGGLLLVMLLIPSVVLL